MKPLLTALFAVVFAYAAPAHAGRDAADDDEPWRLEGAAEEVEVAPFDATPVSLDSKLRIEAHAALWMLEQAGGLRTSNPALGAGVSGMATERIRWDVGALVTAGQVGTPNFNVFSVYPSLRARLHYGWAFGGTWLFVGGGPSITALASWTSIQQERTDASFTVAGGPELAVGLQTEVTGRLVRFEIAAASRGLRALRIDGRAGLSVGF